MVCIIIAVHVIIFISRYTSLKERLDACESDLQEKTDKVKVLQKEVHVVNSIRPMPVILI